MAVLAFTLVHLLLLPVTLLGTGLWLAAILLGGRRSGASVTAQGPLFACWLRHHLGVRPDEAAARLLPVLPGVPPLAPLLVAAPTLLAHRLTGYVPAGFRPGFQGRNPAGWKASRLLLFDAALERHPAPQFVVLGAGFDTRAYRPPRRRAFELDLPRTQAAKRHALARAGVDTSGVTFVSADLEAPDWMDRLVAAGFDPAQPAFFLWEGVTMYLQRHSVDAVLRRVASCAPGSVVAFDSMTPAALASPASYLRLARAMARLVDEPLRTGLDPLRDLPPGLRLVQHVRFGAWGAFTVAARA